MTIVDYLRGHELFHGLDLNELDAIADRVSVEDFAAGVVIVAQDAEPVSTVRLVERGAVDLLDQGRALDRLGEGDLFGHPSMLSGLPTGFEVRAVEDTRCLRLAEADALRVLGRPSGLRYVARSLLARPARAAPPLAGGVDPTRQPVGDMHFVPAVVCPPDTSVADAARLMVERGASSVLVKGEAGLLGIVTDRDVRARVLAAERGGGTPVAEVMTAPVVTVPPEHSAADVMLLMLDRCIRHMPVVAPRGEIVGVLRDIDLLALQSTTPFTIRREIAAARDTTELRRAATRLQGTVVTLHDARMNAAQIGGVMSVVVDAVTRRLLELAGASGPLAWIALGSYGRREPTPSSDLDSAVAWRGPDEPPDSVTQDIVAGLEACDIDSDPNGAVATNPLFARSVDDWDQRLRELLRDPRGEQSMIFISLLGDARVVRGAEWIPDPFAAFASAPSRPLLRRLLLRVGLTPRPPTGFLRNVVVENSGEHRGRFDIKRGGLLPIVNIARYGGVSAGSRVTGTVERLRIAGRAGILGSEIAESLEEAFNLLTALRLDHQVAALRDGRPADDFIDPRTLNPLARRYLRDAFRAIASTQRALGNELDFSS